MNATTPSATIRALDLPEILYEVLACLKDQAETTPQQIQASIKACTMVNRTWFYHAIPFLYRSPFVRHARPSETTRRIKALQHTLTTTNRGIFVRSLSRCQVELWELFPELDKVFEACPRLASLALTFRGGQGDTHNLMEPFMTDDSSGNSNSNNNNGDDENVFNHSLAGTHQDDVLASLDPTLRKGMAHILELDLTSVAINSVTKADNTGYTDAALNCISACTRLQKLTTTRADWSNIKTISKNLVDLSISFVAPPDLQTSLELAKSLERLKSLHLHYAPQATPYYAFSHTLAMGCRELTRLDICAEAITCRSLELLVKNNRGLTYIHLHGCSDEYTRVVLENPPSELEFFDMGIVDSQLILRALSVCPKLLSTGKTSPRNNNTIEFWKSFLEKARQIQELHVERWSDFHSKDLFFNTVLPHLGPQLVRLWFGWRDLLGCDELERVLTSCDRLQVLRAPVKGNGQNLVRCFKTVSSRSQLREVRLFGDNVKFCDDDKRRMQRFLPVLCQFSS